MRRGIFGCRILSEVNQPFFNPPREAPYLTRHTTTAKSARTAAVVDITGRICRWTPRGRQAKFAESSSTPQIPAVAVPRAMIRGSHQTDNIAITDTPAARANCSVFQRLDQCKLWADVRRLTGQPPRRNILPPNKQCHHFDKWRPGRIRPVRRIERLVSRVEKPASSSAFPHSG